MSSSRRGQHLQGSNCMLGTGRFMIHLGKIPVSWALLVLSLYRPGNRGQKGEVLCALGHSVNQCKAEHQVHEDRHLCFFPYYIPSSAQCLAHSKCSVNTLWMNKARLQQKPSSLARVCALGVEGNQNLSPQNMPLWHESYFELKVTEKQQMQGKFSTFPLATGNKFYFVRVCPSPLSHTRKSRQL